MTSTLHQSVELIPVEDHKICSLLQPDDRQHKLEASGVCMKDGHFYVIFDNLCKVAQIDEKLSHVRPQNSLLPDDNDYLHNKDYGGYEDITYNQRTGEFYLLVESVKTEDHENKWESKIIQCDSQLIPLKDHPVWVDTRITVQGERHNKGLEGITWINRHKTDFLLVLHEMTGLIYVCRQSKNEWKAKHELRLPVQFEDYSSLDVKDNRVVVASQESAKLWVGGLDDNHWRFVGDGQIYSFPDDYCNIEGVAWVTLSRIVAVSDKAKDDQPDICQCLDQSIHIFDLPGV